MEYTKNIKEKARRFRSQGKTYSEIRKILGISIPKSTLSYWCSHISLPKWFEKKIAHLNKMNLTKAQKAAWYVHKHNREIFLENLRKQNEHIVEKLKDKDILKMLLAMLYLGEGSKWTFHRGLMLGSSDPNIVKLYLYLLKICYKLMPTELKCRVSYRADQNIDSLQKYWSKITSIPLKNFYKTKPDPRTVGKPTKNQEYKGVCVICGGGTRFQLELDTIYKLILGGIAQLV